MDIASMRKRRRDDVNGMERKRWDPQCPRCQEELKRSIELSKIIFEDMDHGAGIYRIEELYCDHKTMEKEEGQNKL